MKVPLECPVCGNKRLLDTDDAVVSKAAPVKDLDKIKWTPDYYIKCWKCKTEIALKKVS